MIQAPMPLRDRLVGRSGCLVTSWVNWFSSLTNAVSASPDVLKTVSLTGQSANVSTTAFGVGALRAGLYRVTTFARITRAATTSSSLTVTVSFTNGGVACSHAGAALTGNTTTTVQGNTFVLQIDQTTPVSYATTYSSTGATAMQYSVWLALEQVA